MRNPKRTYLEMVEQRGISLSPQFHQCASNLKRDPIDKFIRSLLHKLKRKLNFTMCPGASLVQTVDAHSSMRAERERQRSSCF